MKDYEKVYAELEKLNIAYNIVEHPPALTTEEADKYIEGMEGVRTKTLFLTNDKKKVFYLLIMDGADKLDMKNFSNLVEEKRVKFASDELLFDKLGVTPGTVSLFSLLNDEKKEVRLYFDSKIMKERIMTFHPNNNTKTIFLLTEDILKFLECNEIKYHII